MATVEIENERGPLRSRVLSMRSRFDLVFDAVLLLSYGVAYTFRFTGIAIHGWFGLGFAVALLGHLTLHWDWVVRTTRRLFTTTGRRRMMWLVNVLLLLSMTLCVSPGIIISAVAVKALGFATLDGNDFWSNLHVRTTELSVWLLAMHVALDWRWIVTVVRRWVGVGGTAQTARHTTRAPCQIERRPALFVSSVGGSAARDDDRISRSVARARFAVADRASGLCLKKLWE